MPIGLAIEHTRTGHFWVSLVRLPNNWENRKVSIDISFDKLPFKQLLQEFREFIYSHLLQGIYH